MLKHEPRPRVISAEAIEIALLVKQVGTIKGAELIEQYGRAKFSEGSLEATVETSNRIMAAIEAPLVRTEPV